MQNAIAQRVALAAVAALALLQVLWELWLAPLAPGGSWLALKALPLAVAWFAIRQGRPRAGESTALLLMLYFTEGVVRAWSEPGRYAAVAFTSAAIALIAFAALYVARK